MVAADLACAGVLFLADASRRLNPILASMEGHERVCRESGHSQHG
jgi:hypothetical protein